MERMGCMHRVAFFGLFSQDTLRCDCHVFNAFPKEKGVCLPPTSVADIVLFLMGYGQGWRGFERWSRGHPGLDDFSL